MKKLLVVSCLAEDCFAKNSEFLLKNHLEEVKSGVSKKASDNDADVIWLLPNGSDLAIDGADVRYGSPTLTGENEYSCAQQLKGNLPRPMIQDDYVAEYDGKEVIVMTPEEAYRDATGKSVKFITINKGETSEVKEVAVSSKLSSVVDASDAKAVLVGGLRGKFILPASLDQEQVLPYFLYDSVTLIDKSACMVDTTIKYMDLAWQFSCGKCVTCREGSLQFKTITAEMTQGKAKPADIPMLQEVAELVKAGSYCPYGQNMPNILITALQLFSDEFDAHVKRKSCPAGVCYKKADVYVILPDQCTGCGDCIDECEYDAIEGKPKFIHMIDQDMCEACGKCVSACDEEAIVVVTGKMPKLPRKLTKVGKF